MHTKNATKRFVNLNCCTLQNNYHKESVYEFKTPFSHFFKFDRKNFIRILPNTILAIASGLFIIRIGTQIQMPQRHKENNLNYLSQLSCMSN